MNKKIIVVCYENLQNIIYKGEIIENYYNPKNYFKKIIFVCKKNTIIDEKIKKKLFGNAEVKILNILINENLIFFLSLFNFTVLDFIFNNIYKRKEFSDAHSIICYGLDLGSYISAKISNIYNIRFIPTLINNPDINTRYLNNNIVSKIKWNFNIRIENYSLKQSYKIRIIYKSIIEYLNKRNFDNYKLIYSSIDKNFLNVSFDYSRKEKSISKIIYIGRLMDNKNPLNIIKIFEFYTKIKLKIIGNGNYKNKIIKYIKKNNINDQIKIIDSVNNWKLSKELLDADIFVCSTNFAEFPKTLIEAISVGIPCIINKNINVPELKNINYLIQVDDNPKEYLKAIKMLMSDKKIREQIGKKGKFFAFNELNIKKNEDIFLDYLINK